MKHWVRDMVLEEVAIFDKLEIAKKIIVDNNFRTIKVIMLFEDGKITLFDTTGPPHQRTIIRDCFRDVVDDTKKDLRIIDVFYLNDFLKEKGDLFSKIKNPIIGKYNF